MNRWRRRAPIVLAAVVVGLLTAGLAAAVTQDFLDEQERVDQQLPPPAEWQATGDRVEIARGADWSFMAWRANRGLCLAYAAGAVNNWARSCGLMPDRADDERFPSDYLIATLIAGDGASDGKVGIVGAVTSEVHRLELELTDGRTLSATTQTAPAALHTSARVFIVRAPIDVRGRRASSAPPFPVRAYVSYDSAGTRLERLSAG
jgi:hypothetical protein